MKKLYTQYIDSFRGLSKEVWWLALITLVNRAGTMVIPFLSLYLTQSLGFSLENVGSIMTSFGLGSLAGTWIGGRLTDKIGYYKVMLTSLIATGFLFIAIQFLEGFWPICIGIFILMVIADAFRPAVFVALSAYSKPENKTRSVTLIRLAINLGFSAGPALGGIIITSLGYGGLFWVDGFTCMIAGILLLIILNPRKSKVLDNVYHKSPKSAYRDMPFLLFIAAMVLFAFAFVQYFSTMPVYYSDIHSLSEFQIGLLLALNGFFIFVFEMPLIKFIESRSWSKITNIIFGLGLTALSFILLNLFSWIGILTIGMLLMTIGEMIAFPFSNAFAMDRAKRGNQGEYMALYSMSFSIAHIFGHNSGMQSIAHFGYELTWYGITVVCLLGISLLLLLRNTLIKHT
ncbi:MFS transporter [Maribacter polysiphoniae]|uniref:MFS transporter n=1 Tax=Maribacter polysiphoniae TaxID=429344 RepID=A0A316E614_9FLAO|nr:MFS transporter [Maribacter polysiphoniae]MBD1259240.1 MFS transporter [Maribacter polysiphoniae]PWK24799.1 putative MFS family arabinose efflux permease [Maribacter polysiphoniae]